MHKIYLISWIPRQIPFDQMLRVWTCLPIQAPFRSCCTLGTGRGWRGRTGQRCPIRDCPGEMGEVCGQPASWGFPGHLPSWAQCTDNLLADTGQEALHIPSPLIYFPSPAFCHDPRVTGPFPCSVPQSITPVGLLGAKSLPS